MGSPAQTFDELLKFLLTIDEIEMIRESFPLRHRQDDRYGWESRGIWAPIVEVPGTDNPFLTESVAELTLDRDPRHVDLLFGYTNAVRHLNAKLLNLITFTANNAFMYRKRFRLLRRSC